MTAFLLLAIALAAFTWRTLAAGRRLATPDHPAIDPWWDSQGEGD